MQAPEWFVKELKIIDPEYYLAWREDYRYWEMRKRMEINRTDKDNGVRIRIKDPVLAVFRILNDDALLSLRKRKYTGIQYSKNPLKYLADIQARNKEAQAKGRLYAQEMQAEGYVKIANWGKKQVFDTPRKVFKEATA